MCTPLSLTASVHASSLVKNMRRCTSRFWNTTKVLAKRMLTDPQICLVGGVARHVKTCSNCCITLSSPCSGRRAPCMPLYSECSCNWCIVDNVRKKSSSHLCIHTEHSVNLVQMTSFFHERHVQPAKPGSQLPGLRFVPRSVFAGRDWLQIHAFQKLQIQRAKPTSHPSCLGLDFVLWVAFLVRIVCRPMYRTCTRACPHSGARIAHLGWN